jgi:alanyl-tRNA synthetase
MTYITTAKLREDFIGFFRNKQHKFLNPSKVFNNDPTLFFVNAGMNQLKDVFTGKKDFDDKYSKLVNCQTCIRAGGKHNDLDDVGKDTYHLTSFGMLGNWSLNKYWKDEAISLAFEYLTTKCNLDRNRMYATYFEGNENIPEDIESKNIWKKYLPDDHIISGSYKDNFWTMGETGPCGACTEIHYDLEEGRFSPNLVNKGDPTLIEVWNLVFMEYNMEYDDKKSIVLKKLDKKYVDTGLGNERLAMIMQNKKSIFQTDIFQKLLCYVEIVSNCEKYTDTYEITSKKDIACNI